MNRRFDLWWIAILLVFLAVVGYAAHSRSGYASTASKARPAKRIVEQHCTVVADIAASEVPAEIKKLNQKGIRVQSSEINLVGDGKFTIIILDKQEEPDEEDEESGR